MKLKLSACVVLMLICNSFLFAQGKRTALIKGKIFNSSTKAGYNDLKISIPDLNVFTTSDGEGNFSISNVPFGKRTIVISGSGAKEETININVDKKVMLLGNISISSVHTGKPDNDTYIPTISVEENNVLLDDDGSSSSMSSGSMFSGSQDPFQYMITGLGIQFRFQQRGFNAFNTNTRGLNTTDLQVNGLPVNDIYRGISQFSRLGGLNNVLRSRNQTTGLKPSAYSYGSLARTTYIDATAADQRKGTTVSYTHANRLYNNQVMLTHNSGLLKNGWAYSASASHRWAKEAYIPGTFYNSYSFYGAVSKVIRNSQFNLTAVGSSIERGRSTFGSMDEVFGYAKNNQYNRSWGYQEGRKRNANGYKQFEPMLIANYTYKPDDNTRWNTAIGYQTGRLEWSSFDFYNAYNPYKDYYRNLPSYYLNFTPPALIPANAVAQKLEEDPGQLQVDWNGIYNSNYINFVTIKNINGISGNDYTGRRSLYVIASQVEEKKTMSFNSNIEHAASEHMVFYGGVKANRQSMHIYKRLDDLLGGDYYVNYNQFATEQAVNNPNAIQNDMDKPNQLVKVGDTYGYDVNVNILQSSAWAQASFTYNKVEFFGAAEAGYTSFNREGLMRNGLFAGNSLGMTPAHGFITPRVKGGVTYKLDMRNYLFFNAEYRKDAPNVQNTYISVLTRDYTINNPVAYAAKTAEAGYVLKSPILNARITGYVTDITDYSSILRFFNDDPSVLSFVNYAMTDVSMRSLGTELFATLKLHQSWSLTGLAAVGQTFYTNSPIASVYQDNDPAAVSKPHRVYIKNYYATTGPQSVYALRANYNPRNYWHANVTLNYIDRSYVSINPDRRTPQAVNLVPVGSAKWKSILNQERLPGAYTVDLYGGKSFLVGKYLKKLKHRTTLNVNGGISNVLDKKDIKRAGFEQLRFDYANSNPNKFANRYNYAYGINFFASISLSF